jgi:peptide/nickel transport system substrate-binding protein
MRFKLAVVAAIVLVAGCAADPQPRAAGRASDAPAVPLRPSPTLVFIARGEPENLNAGWTVGTSSSTTFRFFNATIALRDEQGVPRPQLATVLPEVNTDAWRVSPDGRMTTTYRLKPNLTWHDGQPLTADDFVFAWNVLRRPDLGQSGDLPQALMDSVEAPDPLTIVVRWSQAFPGADLVEGFVPLPSHLLASSFGEMRADAWASMSFWKGDYVGLGAFKIDNWDPGASVDASAFDGYVFGRPKIDRLRIVFMQDPNTVAANLLSGAAQLVADITIRSETGSMLKREWAARNGGSVYFTPAQIRFTYFQLRPEYVSQRDTLDLRVRQAIAHAVDKPLLAETLQEGQGIAADALVRRGAPEFASVDSAVTRYPYDQRRAQQLLDEAGLTRDGEGFYQSTGGGRFAPEWKATAGGDTEIQLGLLADSLRRIGVDAREKVLPRPFDSETRATFITMMNWSTTNQPDDWLLNYASSKTPGPENRWTGSNYGAWINADYDRLASTFATALDRGQRSQLVVQMTKTLSEQLPILPLYYNLDVVAHTAALKGVKVVPDGSIGFNVQDWEMN